MHIRLLVATAQLLPPLPNPGAAPPLPPGPPGPPGSTIATTTTRNPDGSTTVTTVTSTGVLPTLGGILGAVGNGLAGSVGGVVPGGAIGVTNPGGSGVTGGTPPPGVLGNTGAPARDASADLEECPDDGVNDRFICLLDEAPSQRMLPASNGCGPAIFGDLSELSATLLPPEFNACCHNHDVCYGTCGRTRRDCDQEFSACLNNALRQQSTASLLLLAPFPTLMSTAVTRFGCAFFRDAQRENCECVLDGSPPFPAVPPPTNLIPPSSPGSGVAGALGAIANPLAPGASQSGGASATGPTEFPQLPPLSETLRN